MTEVQIVVVGFKMNQKKAIGYRSFFLYTKAAEFVKELLEKEADVISIRRVKEE
jgi:hypothetical protein